jgi:signal transduction histidine kinase
MTNEALSRRILLVEDNVDDRGFIHRMLHGRRRAYRITDCVSGADAIARLREHAEDFDCVLLDYHLADRDAISVMNALRTPRGLLPLPISLLTGWDDDSIAASVLEHGAEDFLLKDALTANALVRSIENAIERFDIRCQLDAEREAVEVRNTHLEAVREQLQLKVGELAAANQSRDRFIAMMSHEMRTPLNAVLGYAEILELEVDGPLSVAQHRHLGRIRIGSRHLLDLIDDVLDLARSDAQRMPLNIRAVDVMPIMEEVQTLLYVQASQKQLALTVAGGFSDRPFALADPQRLRQIIMNLVGNAIKFTESGSVVLSTDSSPDRRFVRISVTDTGIGMPTDVRERVFQEFYQGDSTLTRAQGGSGLGLAISRRLAAAMQGEINVTSEVRRGSTFTLSLPASISYGVLEHDAAELSAIPGV